MDSYGFLKPPRSQVYIFLWPAWSINNTAAHTIMQLLQMTKQSLYK